jgi:hypothetical protein
MFSYLTPLKIKMFCHTYTETYYDMKSEEKNITTDAKVPTALFFEYLRWYITFQ